MPATKVRRKSKRSGSNRDLYQEVSDKICASLDAGTVPWANPIVSAYGDRRQRNLVSGKAYRGINPFLLDLAAFTEGYTAPYWVTFKQALDLGKAAWIKESGLKGQAAEDAFEEASPRIGVRKGEKSTLTVLFKPISVKDTDKEGKPTEKTIVLLRYNNVFNVEQCDGVPYPKPERGEDFEPLTEAQKIVDDMPQRPVIRHQGSQAFYRPQADDVTVPVPEDFRTRESYYGTLYHELAHSTGHESRLHRVKNWGGFGSEPYAQEELVAEMTAAMLCSVAGVNAPIEHSAAYIANWSQVLQEDRKFVVMAAARAQKAADFILGVDA